MSEWERAERRERIERMAEYIRRGVRPCDVFEEFGDATRADLEAARQRARRTI